MLSNPAICLEEQALTLDHVTPEWIAVTTDKAVHITRTVLIAGGIGSFMPRKLRAPGVEEFSGHGVYHFVKNKEQFRGQRVLIVGGGDSACDWAAGLQGIASHITLIHRRDVFRAHEENANLLTTLPISMKLFNELVEVHGDDRVRGATIEDNRTKTRERIEVDAVLLTIGFQASLGPISGWGLQLEGNSIRVDSTMATNLPGVFAAGDVATYPGKITLIATGVGEAATAVNHAKRYLDPTAKVAPGHSSDLDTSVKNVKIAV
jgi:thioredoxin reductase (NADPH)